MTEKKKPQRWKSTFDELPLGPMPVDTIYATLGLELEAGEVVFSPAAQRHAMRRHPDDFVRCLPHMGGVVTGPLYVGDDFRIPARSN